MAPCCHLLPNQGRARTYLAQGSQDGQLRGPLALQPLALGTERGTRGSNKHMAVRPEFSGSQGFVWLQSSGKVGHGKTRWGGRREEGPVCRVSQIFWSLSQKKVCLLRSSEVSQSPDSGVTASPKPLTLALGCCSLPLGWGRESHVRSKRPECSHPLKSPRSTLPRPLEGHPEPDFSEFY